MWAEGFKKTPSIYNCVSLFIFLKNANSLLYHINFLGPMLSEQENGKKFAKS